jgi:hypothetical protein
LKQASKTKAIKRRPPSKKRNEHLKRIAAKGGIAKHIAWERKTKPGTKEFTKLQNKWYNKLKRSGFDDIEWTDTKTGFGQSTSYLKNSRNGVNAQLDPNKELYYTMCRNWLAHAGPVKKIDRIMFELHAEGFGYRDIVERVKHKLKKSNSHTAIFMRMKPLIAEMIRWNESDPQGLIKSREQEDFEIELYANTIWQKEN